MYDYFQYDTWKKLSSASPLWGGKHSETKEDRQKRLRRIDKCRIVQEDKEKVPKKGL